jgi:hypothetical protein
VRVTPTRESRLDAEPELEHARIENGDHALELGRNSSAQFALGHSQHTDFFEIDLNRDDR